MRLVLDTNVWLDWLVFDDPRVGALREAHAARRAEIFIDAVCEAELARVLAYDFGARSLDAAAQAACLSRCREIALLTKEKAAPASLPRCRDADDQKFLEAALAARADFLITKDLALLELQSRKTAQIPFSILTPEDFAAAAKRIVA